MYLADQTTQEMASFSIEGNITDHTWPFIVTTASGKPDTQAISLLAHIVYWYRPAYIHQPDGSMLLGKKYKSDLLQRSYAEIENMLGLTKRQSQEAFDTLERLDFCKRELRTIEVNGQKISNVMFIRLNYKNLSEKRQQYLNKCISSYENCHEGVRKLSLAHDKNVTTYTYSTTKTSQEKQQHAASPPDAAVPFKSLEKEQPKPKVYPILKDVDIPESDKVEITSKYGEPVVEHAVAFATHPEIKLTKSLAAAVKWACQNKPKVPEKKKDVEEINKAYAMKYDEMKNATSKILACNKYVQIINIHANGEYQLKYEEKGFMEQFQSALRKYGFTVL